MVFTCNVVSSHRTNYYETKRKKRMEEEEILISIVQPCQVEIAALHS